MCSYSELSTFFILIVPPEYTLKQSYFEEVEGTSLSVSFSVDSEPPITDDVKHNLTRSAGERVSGRFTIENSCISFRNVSICDSGVYTISCCNDDDKVGKADVELVVTPKPDSDEVIISPQAPFKGERHLHARTHAYIHARTHAYIHARTHAYIHARTHAYIHARTHAYIHARTHAYIHARTHAYIHACIHAYIHAYIHTYIHAYMHTYIILLHMHYILRSELAIATATVLQT